MELLAGARTPKQRRVVERLLKPYSQASRIIHLEATTYYKAGVALAKLGIDRKSMGKGFSHDLLIALSAHSIGATLFTQNKNDFVLIAKAVPVKLQFVDALH
ncbi:MAG: hypothetical protein A2Z88_01340 [Omnitrophica WOR_2 bacterium GWA2_47_8]|nr:MAG: hypothetical protein A2Z88_01340 [Omnitrophica WOR_2 bacterium GWA2_47_8]